MNKYSYKFLNLGFLIFLLGAFLFVLFIRIKLVYIYYSDIGGIESNVIYSIQRFLGGFPLYDHPETSPFSITQYSPLYYRLVAFISHIFGINPDNPIEVYRVSRAFALTSNLLYTFFIFKIGRLFHLNFSKSVCVAAMAFILLPPQLYSRPDSVATLMSLVVIYLMINYLNKDNTKKLFLGLVVVFVALGISTKQSSIVLPLIVCSYILFFEKNIVKALLVGVLMAATTLLFLFVLMPEHDLELLYLNNIVGVKQGLDWNSYATNIFLYYFRTYALINAIGLSFSVWLIFSEEKLNKWLGWFVLSFFFFAAFTSLKQGSALNYFTEFVSLSPIAALVFFRDNKIVISKGISSLILAITGFWITAPNMINFTWRYVFTNTSAFHENYIEQQRIKNYVEKELGLQPTDKLFVTIHNYSFLNGFFYKYCILPQQEIVTVMYPKGDFNYRNLDTEVSENKIRFVIAEAEQSQIMFPHGLSLDNYALKKKFAGFDVYQLKSFKEEGSFR